MTDPPTAPADDHLSFELALIGAQLRRLGYACEAVDDEDELSVWLSDDDGGSPPHGGRETAVLCSHVSDDPPMRMLMLSTSYPFDASGVGRDIARRAAAEVTQYLVLGHFEVDDDDSVHLRYSMPVEPGALPGDQVVATVLQVLDYQQVHFGDYLEAICAGRVTIDTFDELVAAGEG